MCTYFLKCIIWGSNFKKHLCFENAFFDAAILKSTYVLKCIFWSSNYQHLQQNHIHLLMLFYHWLCGSIDKWIENVGSEYNYKCKKQVILLMITDGKKWHLAVTNLSALLAKKIIKSWWRFLLFKLLWFIHYKE